jgi:hypothetical protein
MGKRSLIHLAAVAATLGLAACGGAGGAPVRPPAGTAAAATSPPRLPSAGELERRLGNSFRFGLRRLSIAIGVVGETADLGQPVPSGLLDDVSCRAAGSGSARCNVAWSDLQGRRHLTGYRVSGSRNCFTAVADPQLPGIRDVTVRSLADHPLQELVGASRC